MYLVKVFTLHILSLASLVAAQDFAQTCYWHAVEGAHPTLCGSCLCDDPNAGRRSTRIDLTECIGYVNGRLAPADKYIYP